MTSSYGRSSGTEACRHGAVPCRSSRNSPPPVWYRWRRPPSRPPPSSASPILQPGHARQLILFSFLLFLANSLSSLPRFSLSLILFLSLFLTVSLFLSRSLLLFFSLSLAFSMHAHSHYLSHALSLCLSSLSLSPSLFQCLDHDSFLSL